MKTTSPPIQIQATIGEAMSRNVAAGGRFGLSGASVQPQDFFRRRLRSAFAEREKDREPEQMDDSDDEKVTPENPWIVDQHKFGGCRTPHSLMVRIRDDANPADPGPLNGIHDRDDLLDGELFVRADHDGDILVLFA